jgi:DNA-directed RNA polymerase subunit RPC12/RpoP
MTPKRATKLVKLAVGISCSLIGGIYGEYFPLVFILERPPEWAKFSIAGVIFGFLFGYYIIWMPRWRGSPGLGDLLQGWFEKRGRPARDSQPEERAGKANNGIIQFNCGNCGRRVRTANRNAGKKARCPICKSLIIVPGTQISTPQQHEQISTGPIPGQTEPDRNQALATAPFANADAATMDSTAEPTARSEPAKKKLGLLSPHYDEATLFAMSVMFVILYAADKTMRADLHNLYPSHRDFRDTFVVVLLLVLFVGGIAFSIIHAFSRRKKTVPEKVAMLFFAVLVSGGTGLYAGNYMIQHSEGCYLLIFAIWNVIYSGLLLIKFTPMFLGGPIDTSYISDEKATPPQVLLALTAVVVIFICCRYWFGLHWAITFSICIAYTTSLDRSVRSVLGRS